MGRSYKIILPLAIAAAAGVLPGCGSSGSSADTAPSLTKAQLTQQIDQICKKRLEEKHHILAAAVKELSQSRISKSSSEQIEELVHSLLPPYQQMSAEIKRLPASGKNARAVEDIATELDSGIARAESDPRLFAKLDLFKGAGKAAKSHGFEACNL